MNWKTSILGAGAWGTTIARLLSKKGYQVCLWEVFPDQCQKIQTEKENSKYLPGVGLDFPTLSISSNLQQAMHFADLLILAIPSKYLQVFLPNLSPLLRPSQSLLSLVKGILPGTVPRLLLDDLQEMLPNLTLERMAVLSGPNFAKEIAQDLPAATVVAGQNTSFLEELQQYLSTAHFRVYTNQDFVGVQLGGILKNGIAVAAGLMDGKSMGYNAKSSLIVRGIAEMSRLFIAMGGLQETLYGLSGLGDLIGTCTSPLSRNWWAGTQLAKGITYDELQKTTGATVEGIDSLPGLLKLADIHQVELPICKEINRIVFQGKGIEQSIQDLMTRKLRSESKEF